jgi:hypothetical protein
MRIAPREILLSGKIFVLFLLVHFGVYGKISVGFKPILKTTKWLVPLAFSGKISRGARGQGGCGGLIKRSSLSF